MNNDSVFDEKALLKMEKELEELTFTKEDTKAFSEIEKELASLGFTKEDERLFDEQFKQIADFKGDMFDYDLDFLLQ